LIKCKTREIEACLIDHCGCESSNPGQRFSLILWLLRDVRLWAAAASSVTAQIIRTSQIRAKGELIFSPVVIDAAVVLISISRARQGELNELDVRKAVESSPSKVGSIKWNILTSCAGRRANVEAPGHRLTLGGIVDACAGASRSQNVSNSGSDSRR